jgi:hypothetical protein
MLAIDVVRADWREWLRERAFRNGLILLPAGDRTLRFYPRYDMEASAIEEALAILRQSVSELIGAPAPVSVADGPEVRPGAIDVPPGTLEVVDLNGPASKQLMPQVHELEDEQYGSSDGRRSFLQYPAETLEATLGHLRAVGVGLRDRVSGRLVAFAIGSPLENHDELGVRDDPNYGDNNAIYLQAMAIDPLLKNQAEVEGLVLDAFRARSEWLGFVSLSSLIESRVVAAGPAWLKAANVVETIENYMQSGDQFVYLRSSLVTPPTEG